MKAAKSSTKVSVRSSIIFREEGEEQDTGKTKENNKVVKRVFLFSFTSLRNQEG